MSEILKEGTLKKVLLAIDGVNVIDIILNCRTTYTNEKSGLEVFKPKLIFKNYITSLKFYLDLVAVLPFDEIIVNMMGADIDPRKLQYVSMVKLTRILRIKKQILQLNIREIQKLILQLFNIIFILFIYIHFTGCLIYSIMGENQMWQPAQHLYYYGEEESFYDRSFLDKYFISIYNAILIISGSDILPKESFHFIVGSALYIVGALMVAHIFGTFAVITQELYKKSSRL